MQRVPVSPHRFGVAVLAALGLLVASTGCKDDEATTPTCATDMTEQGIAVDDAGKHVDGGCNPYPTCRDDQGNLLPPQSCCLGPDAGKSADPTSDQLQCLCAYGVGHCDNVGAGGSSAGTGGAGTGTGDAGK